MQPERTGHVSLEGQKHVKELVSHQNQDQRGDCGGRSAKQGKETRAANLELTEQRCLCRQKPPASDVQELRGPVGAGTWVRVLGAEGHRSALTYGSTQEDLTWASVSVSPHCLDLFKGRWSTGSKSDHTVLVRSTERTSGSPRGGVPAVWTGMEGRCLLLPQSNRGITQQRPAYPTGS